MLSKYFHKNDSAAIGRRGESLATKYLKKHGYTIIARNYRNKRGKQVGEIDIIVRKNDMIIFVEVKTRAVSREKANATQPQEQITPAKLSRLQRAAAVYLREEQCQDASHRFDAVSIIIIKDHNDPPQINHIKSVFL